MAEKKVFPNSNYETAAHEILVGFAAATNLNILTVQVDEVFLDIDNISGDPENPEAPVRIKFSGDFELNIKVAKRNPPWDAV